MFCNEKSATCSAHTHFLIRLIAHIIAIVIISVNFTIANVTIFANSIVIGISIVILIVVGIVIVNTTIVVVAVVRFVSAIARPAGCFFFSR